MMMRRGDTGVSQRQSFEQYAAQVTAVASAKLSDRRLRQQLCEYDVLLSDIGMPEDEDGYALIRQVASAETVMIPAGTA